MSMIFLTINSVVKQFFPLPVKLEKGIPHDIKITQTFNLCLKGSHSYLTQTNRQTKKKTMPLRML